MRRPHLGWLYVAFLGSCDGSSIYEFGDIKLATLSGEPEDELRSEGDEDGDGMSNRDELIHGTDPYARDTDGDSYWDPWEIEVGADPLDLADVIYQGGWPYNPDKALLAVGEWGEARVGEAAPLFKTKDQFGELVDLRDFGGRERDIVFCLVTGWSEGSQSLAAMLAGQEDWGGEWNGLRAGIQRGDVHWVMAVVEDQFGDAPTVAQLSSWAEDYPVSVIPVMADQNSAMANTVWPVSYPSFSVIDADMQWVVVDDSKAMLDWVIDG